MPDHVRGLWYFAAALAYPIAALLAERRYGLTGLIVAFTACLVVQLAIIEPPNGVVGLCNADIGCQR